MNRLFFCWIASLVFISNIPFAASDTYPSPQEAQQFADRERRDEWLRLPHQPGAALLQQTQIEFPLAVRGNIEALVSVPGTQLQLTIIKQDFNLEAGSDAFAVFALDASDKSVAVGISSDDGDATASGVFGPVTQKTMTLNLPEPGVYRLRTNASRDSRYALVVDAPFFGLPSTLELLKPEQSATLYFYAPPNAVSIRLRTQHLDGLGQTIELFDSTEQSVSSVELAEINRDYTLVADVPSEQAGTLWRLLVPKSDVLIEGDGFNYFYLEPESAYPFPSLDNLLLPRSLSMTGAPGAAVPFRFRIENHNAQSLSFLVSAEQTSGVAATVENLSPIVVQSASTARLPLRIRAAQNAADRSIAQFRITLSDEAGTPIVRANAELRIKASAAEERAPRYVFFDEDRLQAIRESGSNGPADMQAIYSSALRFGDAVVADNLPVLDLEAGWTGRYISDGVGDGDDDPNDGDGAPLIFDVRQPHLHISSSDGRIYQGEQYDAGWRGFYHDDQSNRLRGLGLAYALEPKPEYAQLLRAMLTDYATRYKTWPLDDFLGNTTVRSARITTETLGEAIWLHRIALAYSLARWDAAFSDADRIHIEENLLRPAAEIIRGNPMGTSNWQSWHNAAVGLVGYILNDSSMVEFALRGGNGLAFLKANAIRDDGLWFEGSVGYHFFALLPLHLLMEAAEAHGESVYDEIIERAHVSILDMVFPDGSFPNLNDSTNQNVYSRDILYEFCNAHYDENYLFDGILTFIYKELGRPRSDFETLFFGRAYQPAFFSPPPSLKEEMGVAILRRINFLSLPVALMDFGPHGAAHGHFDKLHVSLFGQGNEWLPDVGAVSSSQPTQEGWFRRTIAHNAVMMGEAGQTFDSELERPIDLFPPFYELLQVMRAKISQPAYPQGSVDRTAALVGEDYLIIIDEVADGPAPYDFVFHTLGAFDGVQAFQVSEDAQVWRDSTTGYQYLEAPRLFGQGEAVGILEAETDAPFMIQARHRFGFADDCETLNDWSGNVGLATDATQGEHSLQWIVIPRGFNSIGKSYEIVNPSAPAPQRLTFDYKIEAATFSQFSIALNGLNPNQRDHFIIGVQGELPIGEWNQADIDLTQPEFSFEDPLRTHVLQFRLSGASGFEGFYRIWIDNIQTWSNDAIHLGEVRGLQLAFAGGGATKYFLAKGPSQSLPRTHPVVIARRDGVNQTRHITIAEPFLGQPTISNVQSISDGMLMIERDDGFDIFEYDLDANQYSIFRDGGATGIKEWMLYE
ncbi:MAG: heparinase II/III family protein [Candidatus Hinthialibacter antarcticus]|nr:heparinase II/III family protein [Candidatus Hinthialibacter antarcticus]